MLVYAYRPTAFDVDRGSFVVEIGDVYPAGRTTEFLLATPFAIFFIVEDDTVIGYVGAVGACAIVVLRNHPTRKLRPWFFNKVHRTCCPIAAWISVRPMRDSAITTSPTARVIICDHKMNVGTIGPTSLSFLAQIGSSGNEYPFGHPVWYSIGCKMHIPSVLI